MKTRSISSACFVIITVGLFLLRQYVNFMLFDLFIWFFCAFGTFEVARAIKSYTNKFAYIYSIAFGIVALPVFVVLDYFIKDYSMAISNLNILFVLICYYILSLIIKKNICLAGSISLIYPVLFTMFMAYLNHLPEDKGFIGILLLFVISPCSDTMAYLVGMTYNKIRKGNAKKLCPKLSPNKTIAGAIGGIVGGAIGGILVLLIFNPQLNVSNIWLFFIIVGVVCSFLTETGDLFESYIKRRVGIKDMGKIMPGHGGVMDRIDGMCFASVFLFFVFVLI